MNFSGAMGDFIRLGYDLDDEDDLDDGIDDPSRRQSSPSRNGAIFVVDCSSDSMFETYLNPESNEDETLFSVAMQCIENFIKSKIISSDKDLVGVVLLGTSVTNHNDFKHVYTLLPLEQPGAKSVLTVEAHRLNYAKHNLGQSQDFSFADGLWLCQNLFSNYSSVLSVRQVFVFTCNEDPHSGNVHARRAAQQRGQDLANNGIETELLGLARPDGAFDSTVFWESVIPLPQDQTSLPDPTIKIRELLSRITMKEYRSRALSTLKLNLFGTELAVKIFSFVNVARKPAATKLDRRTNKEVKTKTEMVSSTSGEILMPDEIRFTQTFGGEKIALTKLEKAAMGYIAPKALTVLGFKNIDFLKFTHFIRPSHFIYPDEPHIKGSITGFQALLKSCLSKKVFALCSVVPREGSMPRIASLVPQEEQLDEDGCQTQAPGFHVIYRPYSEDLRDLSPRLKVERPRAFTQQVKAAHGLINKMKLSFDPENFRNPQLSRFYAYLEALALERSAVEEPDDMTNPSTEDLDHRMGDFKENFTSLIFPYGVPSASSASKRKAPAGGSAPAAKRAANANPDQVDTAELRKSATENKLGKYTVPNLKSACELFQLSTTGKKQDLIDRLQPVLTS